MQDGERVRLQKMFDYERELRLKGFSRIAGVDEAGRGPVAGPVVAAACILPEGVLFDGLNDSKQLKAPLRDQLYDQIISCPGVIYAVESASVEEIDRCNILKATFYAMGRAILSLAPPPDFLLIDGNQAPACGIPAHPIVEGDSKSASIAAASILAKVTRDRIMQALDAQFPQYGFAAHKGYGTEQHLAALRQYGPCPLHRKTFDPVKSYFQPDQTLLF